MINNYEQTDWKMRKSSSKEEEILVIKKLALNKEWLKNFIFQSWAS